MPQGRGKGHAWCPGTWGQACRAAGRERGSWRSSRRSQASRRGHCHSMCQVWHAYHKRGPVLGLVDATADAAGTQGKPARVQGVL